MPTDTLRALLLIKTRAQRNDAVTTRDWLKTKDYVEDAAVLWGEFDVYAIIHASSNIELSKAIIKEIQGHDTTQETRTYIMSPL